MDVEYISLHGYIRNTPSDTEVHAPAENEQEYWPARKEYIEHAEVSKTKELGEKEEC